MQNIKLVAFDVDGTLVTVNSRILLESTIDAIHQLQKRGIKVAIATGRPIYAMEKSIMDRIHFDYIIASNGSYVYDNINQKVIFKYEISEEEVVRYTHQCQITNSGALFQFDDAGYIYAGYDKIVSMLSDNLGRIDLVVNHHQHTHHLISKPYAIVSYIKDENIEEFRNSFQNFNFLPFKDEYYDVNPFKITKATGMAYIKEDLGLNCEQTMAFGDAMNDFQMINEAGIGVAMGNALKEIKEIAGYITDNTEKNGIHNALVEFRLIEGKKYV